MNEFLRVLPTLLGYIPDLISYISEAITGNKPSIPQSLVDSLPGLEETFRRLSEGDIQTIVRVQAALDADMLRLKRNSRK